MSKVFEQKFGNCCVNINVDDTQNFVNVYLSHIKLVLANIVSECLNKFELSIDNICASYINASVTIACFHIIMSN